MGPRKLALHTDICDVVNRKYELSRQNTEEEVKLLARELCLLGLAKAFVDPKNMPANDEPTSCLVIRYDGCGFSAHRKQPGLRR